MRAPAPAPARKQSNPPQPARKQRASAPAKPRASMTKKGSGRDVDAKPARKSMTAKKSAPPTKAAESPRLPEVVASS